MVFATKLYGDREFHRYGRGGQIIRRGGTGRGGTTFHRGGGDNRLKHSVPPPESETLQYKVSMQAMVLFDAQKWFSTCCNQ